MHLSVLALGGYIGAFEEIIYQGLSLTLYFCSMPVLTPEIIVTVFLIQALITAFFCRTLYRALLLVRESNRTINAGTVWLLLIPFLEKFWNFGVVSAMSSSLHKEFSDRNFEIEESPGYTPGMIYAVLSVVPSVLVLVAPSLIILAGILNLACLVFFIQYWMKINWYRKVLRDDLQDQEIIPSE